MGQVVQTNWQPVGGARVLFIHANAREPRKQVAADQNGRFQAVLTSGTWLVYLQDSQGTTGYSMKINVRSDAQNDMLRLVSR